MKNKYYILLILLIVFAFLSVSGCGTTPQDSGATEDPASPEEQKFEWKLQCPYAAADIEYVALPAFVDAVSEGTNGNLIITTYSDGAIVPGDQQVEACAAGIIEVSHSTGAYYRGTIPVADLDFGLPGQYPGFGTLDQLIDMIYVFEDGALEDVFRRAYAEHGVYYLGSHTVHGYPAIISKKPISTIDDFKGVVIRSTGSYADLFNMLGASAVFVPYTEMYAELQLGTLDAVAVSVEGLLAYKFYEVAPYFTQPPISAHALGHFLINPDAWNALPPEYQEVVSKAYRETYIPRVFELYDNEWEQAIKMQDELPYEVVTMSDEVLTEIRDMAQNEIWLKVSQADPYVAEAVQIILRWYEQNAE